MPIALPRSPEGKTKVTIATLVPKIMALPIPCMTRIPINYLCWGDHCHCKGYKAEKRYSIEIYLFSPINIGDFSERNQKNCCSKKICSCNPWKSNCIHVKLFPHRREGNVDCWAVKRSDKSRKYRDKKYNSLFCVIDRGIRNFACFSNFKEWYGIFSKWFIITCFFHHVYHLFAKLSSTIESIKN